MFVCVQTMKATKWRCKNTIPRRIMSLYLSMWLTRYSIIEKQYLIHHYYAFNTKKIFLMILKDLENTGQYTRYYS